MNLIDKCQDIARDIYNDLGSGFEEPIYQKAFEVALRLEGIPYENQRITPVFYKGFNVGEQKLDLVIKWLSEELIVELKAILALSPKDATQLKKYMELLNIKDGLLVNFPQFGTAKSKSEISNEPEFKILPESEVLTHD